ncbi:MAG TPA: MaoC family dehydratase [Symbiobacteriaceae bacterium]|nr:MaoC family dehydratase [Symbiobacteriaceae bacterium]
MKHTEFVVEVTDAAVRRFAEASGDWNPIHFDEAAARQAGLPGRCAHGLWIVGLAGQCLAAAGYRIRRISARFERPVLVGSSFRMRIREAEGRFLWEAMSEADERMASGKILVY